MLDNIFLKGSPEQEIENSSISMFQKQNDNSNSEGVKSDLEKSEISEVEEDQPVESTIFKLLLLKVKDGNLPTSVRFYPWRTKRVIR